MPCYEERERGSNMKGHKTRKMGIRTKIVLPSSVLIMVLCIIMAVNSYSHTKDGLVAMGVERSV